MFNPEMKMASLDLDLESTALVLIDLQNGIVGLPLAPHGGAEVVARGTQLATELRQRGATVVYVRVSMSEVLRLPADAPARDPNAPPPPAAASELISELDLQPNDIVITKRQWGAFYGTELDQQ